MIWCFVFLADMAFFLTDTALYFSNCYGILFFVSRPCYPRVILSEAAPPAKNHARPPIIAAQSNPAPSGAPAGGISLVERHHITPHTAKKPSPLKKKATAAGWLHEVVPLADFALIRHWRATFPTRGKASSGCANLFYSTS